MKYDPQKLIEKQKIEKLALVLEQKKVKTLENLKSKYLLLKQNRINQITLSYDKKLEKRTKSIERKYEKMRISKKKKIKGIEVKKIDKTNWKEKSYHEVQLFAKLSRAYILDGDIVILLVDKQKLVKLFKDNGMMDGTIQGGHVYGKRNYPHMAFDIDNIRPINSWTNKAQGDQIAQWKDKLDNGTEDMLEHISKNEILKNDLRDTNFFMEKYEYFKKENIKLCERLGLDYNKSKPKLITHKKG